MKILVTGATGLVGVPLMQRLARAGHQAFAISRNPEAARKALPTVAGVFPSLDAPDLDLGSFDAVVTLAGEPVGGERWNAEKKKRIRDSRVEAARELNARLEKLSRRPSVVV